jgi:ferredoxin-NADP reductase/ferredoxin/truncated hemoglobin YjbI
MNEPEFRTYRIKFNNESYDCRSNETLVDAFHRQGVELKFSCRKGSCQVCMMQCDSGEIPYKAQNSIDVEYVKSRYFLPCVCNPISDMSVNEIPYTDIYHSGVIYQHDVLSADICRVLIEPTQTVNFKPGQYMNLRRPQDGTARSYSLVGIQDDYFLEFHIKKMDGGKLSCWLFDDIAVGDEIDLQGPMGKCYYSQVTDKLESIILAGSGVGLSLLIGIARDALQQQHQGNVFIFHGGKSDEDIYFHKELKKICSENSNLYYSACVENTLLDSAIKKNILDAVLEKVLSISDACTIYFAGAEIFTQSLYRLMLNNGIPENKLFSDSFDFKNLRSSDASESSVFTRRKEDLRLIIKDDEMWQALDFGKKMKIILDDFYSQVYKDKKLSAFFKNSTQQRSSEKQYLFMRQLFTGKKVYFGDRPKNAHHWMVISDELFDYREMLLSECLRKHNLPEHLIDRWLKLDESFRHDIVKHEPQPKIVNGVALPLDGFDELKIDEGTLCDSCSGPIERGETVRYHIRLGLTYCVKCMGLVKSD